MIKISAIVLFLFVFITSVIFFIKPGDDSGSTIRVNAIDAWQLDDNPWGKCQNEACNSLIDLINTANHSIDFAIYGLQGQEEILEALKIAKARGVRIRGVVDADDNGNNYYTDTYKLKQGLETVVDDYDDEIYRQKKERPYYTRIMHNKFFIIDDHYVWTGSANISDTGTGGYNANSIAVIDSYEVGKWYQQEFYQMYIKKRFNRNKSSYATGRRAIELSNGVVLQAYFSPQDNVIRDGILPLIENARQKIDVSVFYLTHPDLAKALIDAHRIGVRVRVIIDSTAAENKYSQHGKIRDSGIPLKVENWGGKMHMKSAAIDGIYLILGSMNWTKSGERYNDENTLIIESQDLTETFHEFFDSMWDSIDTRWLTDSPRPESPESSGSCSDGIDNDFDRLIDERDPDCR